MSTWEREAFGLTTKRNTFVPLVTPVRFPDGSYPGANEPTPDSRFRASYVYAARVPFVVGPQTMFPLASFVTVEVTLNVVSRLSSSKLIVRFGGLYACGSGALNSEIM